MSKSESRYICPKYLLEPYKKGNLCLKEAADYYGVNLKIVLNYEDAINEITKKNREKEGFCDYYSVWIICGHQMKFYLNMMKEMKIKIIHIY